MTLLFESLLLEPLEDRAFNICSRIFALAASCCFLISAAFASVTPGGRAGSLPVVLVEAFFATGAPLTGELSLLESKLRGPE